ncbi:hypothetical protein FOCC_FOCC002356 [Frankliniella occidentalis]|nr:hypothetical protein FOCC_FOCC002356 [Frankliniella occidentalis]
MMRTMPCPDFMCGSIAQPERHSVGTQYSIDAVKSEDTLQPTTSATNLLHQVLSPVRRKVGPTEVKVHHILLKMSW